MHACKTFATFFFLCVCVCVCVCVHVKGWKYDREGSLFFWNTGSSVAYILYGHAENETKTSSKWHHPITVVKYGEGYLAQPRGC